MADRNRRIQSRGFGARGLTVVILALVGIAAMISPNLFGTRRRATVSRVKADMRSLSTAIEAYFTDNNAYPAMRPLRETTGDPEALGAAGGGALSTYECGRGERILSGLTTPVSYISSPFPDGCSKIKGIGYAYYAAPDCEGWMLISTGPDGDYDIANPAGLYDLKEARPSVELINLTYDPTNGSFSSGDIWRGSLGAHFSDVSRRMAQDGWSRPK